MSESAAAPLLDDEQRRRAEALREARGVLVERTGPFSVAAPEVVDMHSLAVFILDGGDPWTLPLEPQSEPFAGLRYDHDEGRTVPAEQPEDEPLEPSSVYVASVTSPGGITFSASVVVPESAAYPDQLELTETVQMASASMASGFKRAENIRAGREPY